MDDSAAEHLREQRFRALLEGVPVAAYRWEAGAAGRCLYVSPQIEAMLGFPPAAVDGATPSSGCERIHPDDRARVMSDEGAAKRRACSTTSTASCTPTGTSCGCAIRRAGSSTRAARRCFEGVFADVTERKRAELELTHTAQHDPLTGPRQPQPVHARSWSTSSPHGGAACCAVLFVDIDRFKLVNDGHGHEAGDALLREAGRRLQAGAARGRRALALRRRRVHRLPARLRRRRAPRPSPRRVLATLAEPFPVARGEVYVGGSVGIALTGGDSVTATELIRDADVAMYAAKQGGRGRWQLFDTSLREASARRVEMVSALHRALELNEIEMLLQPIVDLGDGRLAGVEALLRWRRARRSSCRRSSSCRWPRRPG